MENSLEEIAEKEFANVGDDGLFPNQTDKDIWMSGFIAGAKNNFQLRVKKWILACFNEKIAVDVPERNHRFLEESLELVQSLGCTKEEALLLVDYVFGRPKGEPYQEVGGVMVTLAALCNCNDLNLDYCAMTELQRVESPEIMEKIRIKQQSKPASSPLPQ